MKCHTEPVAVKRTFRLLEAEAGALCRLLLFCGISPGSRVMAGIEPVAEIEKMVVSTCESA